MQLRGPKMLENWYNYGLKVTDFRLHFGLKGIIYENWLIFSAIFGYPSQHGIPCYSSIFFVIVF